VVLRLPTGFVFVMGLAFVGVVVLSYWVGLSRGYHRAERDLTGAVQPSDLSSAPPSLAVMTPVEDPPQELRQANLPESSAVQSQPVSGSIMQKGTGEPRLEGINYFILAHYPEADAERLTRFLWEQGVEAAAIRGEGQKLFQVVALRGFIREELDSPSRQQFEQALKQLGHVWSNQKLGPDFAKSGIYLDLFEGEPIAESITKAIHP
jgi:hypothetical protein